MDKKRNGTPATRRPTNQQHATRNRQASSRGRASASRTRTAPTRTRAHQSKPSLPRIPLAVAALVALAVVTGIATTTFLSQPASNAEAPSSSSRTAYVSPYDFSGLALSGDRMTYTENGVQKSQVGIDVSELQGSINWPAVKKRRHLVCVRARRVSRHHRRRVVHRQHVRGKPQQRRRSRPASWHVFLLAGNQR